MPVSVSINTQDFERFARGFGILGSRFDRIIARAVARARRDITSLFVRHLKMEIKNRTRRRTGRLLRVKVSFFRKGAELDLSPQFPATRYLTPRGRGRPSASKRGQYAFVVNHRKRFIQRAILDTSRDPQLRTILNKHIQYVLDQEIRKLFPNNLQGKSQ